MKIDIDHITQGDIQPIAAAFVELGWHKPASQYERSAVAGIGVGLTADYGAAQVLYVKRGYIPDGRGMIQDGKSVQFGETITIGDDQVIYFTKQLK